MMSHSGVTVLDLQDQDGSMVCKVERYWLGRYRHPRNLVISWNSIRCPKGFFSLNEGVAYLQEIDEQNSRLERYTSRSRPDELGEGKYSWDDDTQTNNRLII